MPSWCITAGVQTDLGIWPACELTCNPATPPLSAPRLPPCSKHIIVHRDLKPANLMLGGIPHDTGTREMAAKEVTEGLWF